MRKLIPLLIYFALQGCGNSERQTENYGDITSGPGGIRLLEESEHLTGWKRTDCLLCHNVQLNVHRNPNSSVDADAILDLVNKNGGASYCLTCHGPNGL